LRGSAELSRDMDYEIARPKTGEAAAPGWLAGVLSPLRYAFIIARKDVATELRTKEIFTATFIFALLSIVIFNFAFDLKGLDAKVVAPGMLWVAFIFAGVLGLNRSIIMEKDRGCLDGLLLCPVSRESIFLGKMVGNIIFMGAMEVVTYPIFAIFSNLPIWAPTLVPIIALGTIGFAAVGTLFSAMAVNTRTREVMLPVLLFRLRNDLLRRQVPVLPYLCELLSSTIWHVVIGRHVEVGPGLIIPHGHAVIDGIVRIGRNCIINPWVTIGLSGSRRWGFDRRGPIIGDRVFIGTGAKVLGPVTVGDDVRIGANAVVIEDVPVGATVVGAPARVVHNAPQEWMPAVETDSG